MNTEQNNNSSKSKSDLDEFWDDYYRNQSKLKGIVEYDALADYCSKAIEILKPKMKKKQKLRKLIQVNLIKHLQILLI